MKLRKFLKSNLVVLSVLVVLIISALIYLWIHRSPLTQNAFIVANVRPVSAFVPGHITEIPVKNNTRVKKGDLLFTVYRKPYLLKVQSLKSEKKGLEFKLKSLTHKIKSFKAAEKEALFNYKNSKYLADQAEEMYQKQATSQKYYEEKERYMQMKLANLEKVKEELAAVQEEYYQTEADISSVASQIENAAIQYELTEVRALSDGIVSNMFLSPGAYVKPGETLFAFVDSRQWWVQANFKETQLASIKPGQNVKIWMWQYPGKEFHGKVASIGWGVDRKLFDNQTGMQKVQKENEWFLLPQRFPVQILITDPDPKYPFHPGGSAFVRVETPANPLRQFFWQLFQW